MPVRRDPGRLLLTIHHLAVDGVSWRILVPDLAAAWQAIATRAGGGAAGAGDVVPALGRAPCGAGAGRRVVAGAFVLERRARQAFAAAGAGQARCGARRGRHGRASDADAAGGGDAGAADAGGCGVPWRHRRRAADRACACGGGLVPAACGGAGMSARSHAVLLDLEGHGREELLGREECRRVGDEGARRRRSDADGGLVHQPLPGAARSGRCSIWRRRWRGVRRSAGRSRPIKEQLRAVPGKGLGYGLLRYLNGETAAQLAGVPAPQLGFNYLGRFAAGGAERGLGAGRRSGRGCAAWRRRSGDAACACDRDQRADAGGGGRPAAGGELDLGRGAARRGCGARSGGALVPGADGAGAACRAARRGRADAERSCAGRSDAGRDRAAGEPCTAGSRTSCRCRRCRRGCCSMRSTTRRGRTSIRCSSSLSLRARWMPPRWRPRCRRWSGGTPACGRASGMSG